MDVKGILNIDFLFDNRNQVGQLSKIINLNTLGKVYYLKPALVLQYTTHVQQSI